MPAEVRLRIRQFQKHCHERGWVSEYQQAQGLGIAPSTINRILRGPDKSKGGQAPGAAFIAAVLAAFPVFEFSDFFEVIEVVNEEPEAATVPA